jgi:hypothetical protein
MDLKRFLEVLASHGCSRLFVKSLSPNDNSKNQVYLGPGFDALQLLPNRGVRPDTRTGRANFKAAIDLSWIRPCGGVGPAPHATLILYPQYPEVRLSGFLRGCGAAPNALMTSRQLGRILFLATTSSGRVVAHAVAPDDVLAKQYESVRPTSNQRILDELPLLREEPISALLRRMSEIHAAGWLLGSRLDSQGHRKACDSRNCAGYTLEAELGIAMNGRAEPDFLGWEIKAIAATGARSSISSKPVTLMTPEPDGGMYGRHGARRFVVHYGYPDKSGAPDRRNFGGRHVADVRCTTSGLTMQVVGFDPVSKRIIDVDGDLRVVDSKGEIAASWSFSKLLEHWSKKHNRAAYVPYECRIGVHREYRFADRIALGQGTSPPHFLSAVASGTVYYDPGLKLVGDAQTGECKARNQFRISSRHLGMLYDSFGWHEFSVD